MPLKYKIEPIKALKEKGYSTYYLQKQNIISNGSLAKMRNLEPIGWENIEKLCKLLQMQPGDIIEYVEE